jgi:uncharacterized protein YjbJ (UPF0337 family)
MQASIEHNAAPGDAPGGDATAPPYARSAAGRARTLPGQDEIKSRWKQRIGAAKLTWGRIAESELLQIEGHEQKLSRLIQERYAVTRDEAVAQVRAFFNKHLP